MRPVTQQLIKNSNMKRLYASVYNHPGISGGPGQAYQAQQNHGVHPDR